MNIKSDFQEYIDGNGLNTPNPQPQPVASGKGSDNGPMFTSEFYIILQKNNQITDQDKTDFNQKIEQCIYPQGILNRVPVGQTDTQEEVDDCYAVLSGCKNLGNTTIPRKFLWAMIKYLTFMDSTNPGKLGNWNAFMFRQPQLIACMVSAGFPSWLNPFHWLMRIGSFFFYFYSAIVIALSCMGTPTSSTDPRRLAWHLIQATAPTSLMCWIASKIWFKRLYNDYPTGMAGVAAIYYSPANNNPYEKYWITS
jgi:hypothetical protein